MNWRSWAHAVGLFVGGGLLISLGDRAHIEFGVLVQTDTSVFGQAWWVVPMFGVVSILESMVPSNIPLPNTPHACS